MNVAKTLKVLERVFSREAASLAHYLLDAHPWVDPTDPLDREAWDLVRRMAAAEDSWLEQLAQLIEARGGIPIPGSYPSEFTDTHYLAVDVLVPRLIQYLDRSIEELSQNLEEVSDDPEARNLLAHMLEEKKKQREELERLWNAVKESVAAK